LLFEFDCQEDSTTTLMDMRESSIPCNSQSCGCLQLLQSLSPGEKTLRVSFVMT